MTRAEAWVGSGHRVAVPRPPGEGAGRHRSSENPEMREPGGRPLIRRRHPERTEGRPVPPRLNRAGRAAPWPGKSVSGGDRVAGPSPLPGAGAGDRLPARLPPLPQALRPSLRLDGVPPPGSPEPLAAAQGGTAEGDLLRVPKPRVRPSRFAVTPTLSHVCPGGWRVRMLLPAQLASGVREVRPTHPHAHTPG